MLLLCLRHFAGVRMGVPPCLANRGSTAALLYACIYYTSKAEYRSLEGKLNELDRRDLAAGVGSGSGDPRQGLNLALVPLRVGDSTCGSRSALQKTSRRASFLHTTKERRRRKCENVVG